MTVAGQYCKIIISQQPSISQSSSLYQCVALSLLYISSSSIQVAIANSEDTQCFIAYLNSYFLFLVYYSQFSQLLSFPNHYWLLKFTAVIIFLVSNHFHHFCLKRYLHFIWFAQCHIWFEVSHPLHTQSNLKNFWNNYQNNQCNHSFIKERYESWDSALILKCRRWKTWNHISKMNRQTQTLVNQLS